MGVTTEFLDAAAVIAERSTAPLLFHWPMPGNLGGLLKFATFAEWRDFVLQFGLRDGIPDIVKAKFDRAHKLHVLAWVDPDLLKAGEQVALTTLELALKDRYGHKVRDKRGNIRFANALRYMVESDGLTDDQVPMNRRCGPPSTVVGRLTGDVRPSLADMRNDLAHGYPFDGLPHSGLLELVRDLIEYAYRDMIGAAVGLIPHQNSASELPSESADSEPMREF
ncbi:hypothetical protein [Limobrevibacterium gyesilva]|uniref:Uncharacterized protein n=1 Tax=Limobrevibacterium gyesilva TaxID=2991712 RepID=A0AA42CIT9_9PROT|nr:hypothetical protein [Limobrevibacterium gyesilva]MCW3476267.1 hypothetical protein [Limobrevibacterium gyesilva]